MEIGDLVRIKGVPNSFCQATRDGGFGIVINKVIGIDEVWVQVISSSLIHKLIRPERLEVLCK